MAIKGLCLQKDLLHTFVVVIIGQTLHFVIIIVTVDRLILDLELSEVLVHLSEIILKVLRLVRIRRVLKLRILLVIEAL